MEKGSLRIVQHFVGEDPKKDILPPICEFPGGCKGRARSLYANQVRKGVTLCEKHENELIESGVISTCGSLNRGRPCTLPIKHNGSEHQYHVDGKLSASWSINSL